jgi:hypothetical protein
VVSDWYLEEMAMTLRLDPEADRQLTEVAESLGLSKQQALADAVSAYISANHQGVIMRRVFAETLLKDKELLERLADS